MYLICRVLCGHVASRSIQHPRRGDILLVHNYWRRAAGKRDETPLPPLVDKRPYNRPFPLYALKTKKNWVICLNIHFALYNILYKIFVRRTVYNIKMFKIIIFTDARYYIHDETIKFELSNYRLCRVQDCIDSIYWVDCSNVFFSFSKQFWYSRTQYKKIWVKFLSTLSRYGGRIHQ